MNVQELAAQCATAINYTRQYGGTAQQASISLVTPKGWKRPPQFPRGKLCLVRPDTGERVWHFNAFNMLAWLVAKKLVQLGTTEKQP